MIHTPVRLVVLGLALTLSVPAVAQDGGGLQARRSLAKTTVGHIRLAAENFEKTCGIKIFQSRLPGEVNCGKGRETIGEAWNRMLADAGYPATPQERELAAQNLGLTSSAALVFFLGPADDEKLNYLLKELEQIQRTGS